MSDEVCARCGAELRGGSICFDRIACESRQITNRAFYGATKRPASLANANQHLIIERGALIEYARTSAETRYARMREAIQVRCHVDINEWEALRGVLLAEGAALQMLAQKECTRRGYIWALPKERP